MLGVATIAEGVALREAGIDAVNALDVLKPIGPDEAYLRFDGHLTRHAHREVARALTEHALGDVAAARETFASIEQRLLDVPSLYRLALYRAREGDPTAARRVLQQALDARPTAGARNALRQRIREEPDFAALRDREAWRALLREEPQSS